LIQVSRFMCGNLALRGHQANSHITRAETPETPDISLYVSWGGLSKSRRADVL
jgi:hypothetical protein